MARVSHTTRERWLAVRSVAGEEVHSNKYPEQPEKRPPKDAPRDPSTRLGQRGDPRGVTSRAQLNEKRSDAERSTRWS